VNLRRSTLRCSGRLRRPLIFDVEALNFGRHETLPTSGLEVLCQELSRVSRLPGAVALDPRNCELVACHRVERAFQRGFGKISTRSIRCIRNGRTGLFNASRRPTLVDMAPPKGSAMIVCMQRPNLLLQRTASPPAERRR